MYIQIVMLQSPMLSTCCSRRAAAKENEDKEMCRPSHPRLCLAPGYLAPMSRCLVMFHLSSAESSTQLLAACSSRIIAWPSSLALWSTRIMYSYVSMVTVAAGTARIMLVPRPA